MSTYPVTLLARGEVADGTMARWHFILSDRPDLFSRPVRR